MRPGIGGGDQQRAVRNISGDQARAGVLRGE
jgi:hypothetical protein